MFSQQAEVELIFALCFLFPKYLCINFNTEKLNVMRLQLSKEKFIGDISNYFESLY